MKKFDTFCEKILNEDSSTDAEYTPRMAKLINDAQSKLNAYITNVKNDLKDAKANYVSEDDMENKLVAAHAEGAFEGYETVIEYLDEIIDMVKTRTVYK